MGITGTEVSKDAASMILADDNFATIVKAVVNGRSVYANIKNAIQFLLSGNTAGIFCVLDASLLALPVPFQPVHLLFINLLTDSLPAIAIGMEPARKGLLDEKPRNQGAHSQRPLLARIGGQGLLIAIVTDHRLLPGLPGGRRCDGLHHGFRYPHSGPPVPWLQLPGLRVHFPAEAIHQQVLRPGLPCRCGASAAGALHPRAQEPLYGGPRLRLCQPGRSSCWPSCPPW